MTARRRLLAAASAGAAVLGLTACQAPAPIVTVVSGTNSEWKEADVYCFAGQSPEQNNCARRADGPAALTVTPGERVGVEVSEEVAARGWYLELAGPDGQPQSSPVQEDKSYFAFTAPDVGANGLRLTVRTVGQQGQQGPPTGEWAFELVPET